MPKPIDPRVRFWAKVDKGEGDGCWPWTAGVNPMGYGLFNRATRPSKCVLAHRYSFELIAGELPAGACVLHRCDTPRCVRPDHMFLGTRTDNAADKVAKGRQRGPKGELNANSKLTAEAVRAVRADWATGLFSKSEIGRRHNIPCRTAHGIINGETWKHLLSGGSDGN